MPRNKGSLNKDRSMYVVKLKNPFDNTESKKEFTNIADIYLHLSQNGFKVSESTIRKYIAGILPPPPCFEFLKA